MDYLTAAAVTSTLSALHGISYNSNYLQYNNFNLEHDVTSVPPQNSCVFPIYNMRQCHIKDDYTFVVYFVELCAYKSQMFLTIFKPEKSVICNNN